MQVICKTKNGMLVNGDNIEVLKKQKDNIADNCISDFPYDLAFMGRKWDNTGNFYEWNKVRAIELYRIIKPGGYVCIFGHPKTNHRMKCAFEDVGFNVVDEIDWVYLTGFPKNQDIGKLFDKSSGAERKVIGYQNYTSQNIKGNKYNADEARERDRVDCPITEPATEQAKKWDDWKTAGLKPAHEPITVFQKPLEGTYIQNIEKYGCGGMNIGACRVPVNPEVDDPRLGGKGTWSTEKAAENVYEGGYAGERVTSSESGRFPPNMIFDEHAKEILDEQTGIRTSGSNCTRTKEGTFLEHGGLGKAGDVQITYGDTGVGSRMFPIIKYCTKVSQKERLLPNGERNPHVTLKPVELIKWLIKLVTPKDGVTIDITAGSGTHAVAVEELNRDEGYNLKWLDIELMNTEKEPYCDTAKMRIEAVN